MASSSKQRREGGEKLVVLEDFCHLKVVCDADSISCWNLPCAQDLRLQLPGMLGKVLQPSEESSVPARIIHTRGCAAGSSLPSLAWGLATQSVFTGHLGGLRAQESGHFLLKSVVSGMLNSGLQVPMHPSRPWPSFASSRKAGFACSH